MLQIHKCQYMQIGTSIRQLLLMEAQHFVLHTYKITFQIVILFTNIAHGMLGSMFHHWLKMVLTQISVNLLKKSIT